jgi:hypothetical protein
MCVPFKIYGVVKSHICHLLITLGRDPWSHQLACADILPVTSDPDPSSREDPYRSFPLFFIARESHAMCWMASRCTATEFKVQDLHP